jgi:hypothetical protein
MWILSRTGAGQERRRTVLRADAGGGTAEQVETADQVYDEEGDDAQRHSRREPGHIGA